MPTNPDITTPLACLYSTVRNISGVPMAFGFLGKHGKRLEAGEQYTVPGNIADQLAAGRSGPTKRNFEALERALAGFVNQAGASISPTLALVSTPPPHLYDSTRDVTSVVTLAGGALGIAAPCWQQYTSF
jgi:hypothetical protein